MINKIIFLFFLSLIFILTSCDNTPTSTISMKLIPMSNAVGDYSEMKSFEVKVSKPGMNNIYSGCKDYPDNKEVGFNLDSGEYQFDFYGYKEACANKGDYQWVGTNNSEIVSNSVNNIKIAIAKVGEFMTSSITMHQGTAFMEASLKDDNIIISGGSFDIAKDLKRINELQCDELGDTNCNGTLPSTWVCNFNSSGEKTSCYDVVSLDDCKAQGASEDKCVACLDVVDNKFTATNDQCAIASCPINKDGYACNMKGKMLLQNININNLSSDLLHNGDNIVKMSTARIFHKTAQLGSNLYFIGGAPEARISKVAPYISYSKYDETRNMIDVYDTEGSSESITSYLESDNINVDFNILKNDNEFYVINGRKTTYDGSEDTFYKDIVKCDSTDCTVDNTKTNNNPAIGALSIKTDSGYYFLGGVRETEVYFNKINDDFGIGFSNQEPIELQNIYGSKAFYYNQEFYFVGGYNYKTGEFNNNIFVYDIAGTPQRSIDIDNAFKNTLFTSIVEYNYNDKDGLLFVGGLQKNADNNFTAINSVMFMSFDNLQFNVLGSESNTELYSLKKARFGHSVIIDKASRIWVIGGLTDNGEQNFVVDDSIEVFTPIISNPEE